MIQTQDEWEKLYALLEGDLLTLSKLVITFRKATAESDIRLASVILRKWLIEGLLSQLCKPVKLKPTFPVIDNSSQLIAIQKHPSVNYFLTAGVRFNGRPVQAIYHSTLPPSDKPLISANDMPIKFFRLGQFIKQKRLYFEGQYFSSEEIIKYVANKLGGAHYDTELHDRFALLEKAAEFMKFGGPIIGDTAPSEIYLCLEPAGSEILSAVHIEIVTAAMSLIQMRLNDQPVMQITTQKSFKTHVREVLNLNKGRYRIYDLSKRSPDHL